MTADDLDRLAQLRQLSVDLRLPDLRRVVQRGRVDSQWDLELHDGRRITVPNIATLDDPRKLRRILMEQAKVIPPRSTPEQWDVVMTRLLAVAELDDTVTGDDEETCGWIAELCRRNGRRVDLEDADARATAIDEGWTFGAADGCTFVGLDDLKAHARRVAGEHLTARQLTTRLRRLGFEPYRLRMPRPQRTGREAGRRFWRSAPDFDAEALAGGTAAGPAWDQHIGGPMDQQTTGTSTLPVPHSVPVPVVPLVPPDEHGTSAGPTTGPTVVPAAQAGAAA